MKPSVPVEPTPSAAKPSAKKSMWKVWVSILFVGAVVAIYYYYPPKAAPAAPGGPGMGRGGGGGGGGRGMRFGGGPTPVSNALVTSGNLELYLTALGSVTALNTATVKSQANGQLLKIHFTEGQMVKQGDLLAEIDPREYEVALAQAEGQLARDTAQLENAKRELERYETAREAVTQQQIDQARATLAQYSGTVRADQASVANYRLQLSYCKITAPISGRVGLRMMDEGNLVRTSDPGLVVITQEDPISVVFSVPEDNLPLIQKSLAAGQKLPVEAFDRSMKVSLAKGVLVAVDNQIDITTGTVKMKAHFENKSRALFPNQFVNVRMLTSTMANVIMAPSSAILLNGQERFVFTISGDTVSRRVVKVGITQGERTVITEGLDVGETVVTEGVDRLQDGSKVTTRTPVPIATPKQRGPGGGRGGPGGEKKGGFGEKGSGGPGGTKEGKDGGAPSAQGTAPTGQGGEKSEKGERKKAS